MCDYFRSCRWAMLVAILAAWPTTEAESQETSVPWEFEADGSAKVNGTIVLCVRRKIDGPGGTLLERDNCVKVPVTAGTTANDKTQAIVDAIRGDEEFNALYDITFDPPDDDFKIELRNPGPNGRYISGKTLNAGMTGEDLEFIKDDPPPLPTLRTGYFSLTGTGTVPGGIAQMRVGLANPLVSVSTFGKPASQVMTELTSAFNSAYSSLGFVALPPTEGDTEFAGIVIDDIPCPLGMGAGTTDTGLMSEVGLADGPVIGTCGLMSGTSIPATHATCIQLGGTFAIDVPSLVNSALFLLATVLIGIGFVRQFRLRQSTLRA